MASWVLFFLDQQIKKMVRVRVDTRKEIGAPLRRDEPVQRHRLLRARVVAQTQGMVSHDVLPDDLHDGSHTRGSG